jgi:hypothetical protein
MSDRWLNYNLYIGDAVEEDVYAWLCESIAPLLMTTQAEYDYYDMYHGDRDLWIMHSTDVSDVSGSANDTITLLSFKNIEDALLAKLRFGGNMGSIS